MERPNTEFKFVGCANSEIQCLQHLTPEFQCLQRPNPKFQCFECLNAAFAAYNSKFAKRMTMAATFLSKKKKQYWVTHRHFWLRRFRNDDGDGNKNVKMTTLYALHIFLYISLLSPPDYDVKMPNFTFYGERKQSMTIFFLFLNLSEVPRKQINSREIYL